MQFPFVPFQRNLPLSSEPDPSGIFLLSVVSLSLSVFFVPLPPIISALLFLPLFGLGIQGIPFLPAVKAGLLPQYVFSPT